MSTKHFSAEALLRSAYLADINTVDAVARLADVPVDVVLRDLRAGRLAGREFPGLGWRITKRAVVAWIESASADLGAEVQL
ncbi:MAG: hypothetical protein IPK60_20760 [Sandaracinaceae bacterium]|nr:hypothetical protein [Sandaracinaceae bacterium]